MTDLSIPVGEQLPARARLLELLAVAWLVAAVLLAALAYQPIFSDLGPVVARLVVVVLAAALVSTVASGRQVPAGRAFLGSVVVGAVVVSYLVLSDTLVGGLLPSLETLRALRTGLGQGFADALGDNLPLSDDRSPLVLVLSLCWTASHATVDLARRTSLAAVPVLPSIALFGLSLPLTAPLGGPALVLVGLLVVSLFAGILLRAAPRAVHGGGNDGRDVHSRALLSTRLLLGLPIVIVLALVAPVIGIALVPGDDPFDPRELRGEVVNIDRVIDPLAEYKAIVGRVPAQALFRVSFAGASALEVARLPVLTLDRWDGVRWTSADRFVKATGIAEPDVPEGGRVVDADLFIGRLPNVYLPRLAAPTAVDIDEVFIDQSSGDMVRREPPDNIGYQVRGVVRPIGSADLVGARVATDVDAARYRTLGASLPEPVTALAQIAQGAASAGEALSLLEATLRTQYANDERSPGGSSAGRLERFLTDRSGSPEQFASTFALVARSLGFPSRLVLGYRVTEERDGVISPLADIGTAQYHVWAEVRFESLGWVAFDPTPEAGQTPPDAPQGQAPATTQANGGGTQQQPDELGPSEAPDTPTTQSTLWRAVQGVALSALVLVAIAGALASVVVGAKGVRRRRQRRGDPAAQVSGAWEGVLDRLGEVGMTLPPSMTPREVSQATEARFGPAVTLPMAAIVPDLSRALYDAAEPDQVLVARVWMRADEFEQNLYDTLPARDRLAARLNPRPLARR